MSKQIKVGLIALVSGVLLYWGFNFLKGTDFLSPTNKYFVVYENVEGLTKSNPVIINGLTVGRVSQIKLLQHSQNKILVQLDVEEDVTLGKKATAALTNTDLLGSKGIVLDVGNIMDPMEPGDTLQPLVDKGMEEILESGKPVINNINTTISRVNEILFGLKGSGEKINERLDELGQMMRGVNGVIAANQRNINDVLSNTAVLMENLNNTVSSLQPLIQKSNGVLDSINNLELNKTLAGVDTVLYNLNETILLLKENEGTLGKLMSEDSLYNNINTLVTDLDKMVIHFDQYPKDFLKPLGRKHKKLEGLSED